MLCQLIRYVSLALMLAGWGGVGWEWHEHGQAAGVDPLWITSLGVGIAFTATTAVAWLVPDAAKAFTLGVRVGAAVNRSHSDKQRPLTLVR